MKKRFFIKMGFLLVISIVVVNACSSANTSEPQTSSTAQIVTKQIIDTSTTVATAIPFTPTPTQPPPSVTGYLPKGALRNISRGEIYDIAVSPDGSQIAIGSVGGIYILDGNDYREKLFVPSDTPDYMINSLDFSGDGANLIAVATFMSGKDQYLYLYQTNDYQLVKKIPFPRKVHYAPPKLVVSPIESLVAVIVDGQRVNTWNYETGVWNGIYNSPGRESFIWDIKFSPNGDLFVANEERVIAMDSNGKINNRYESSFNGRVWKVAISNNGKLAAAYQDERLVVWDVESGLEILHDEKLTFASTPTYFPEIVFSDDDQTLFIPNDTGLMSWDLLSRESNSPIKLITSERNLKNELLQSLPNNRLLSVSVDQVLNVISLEQKALIYTSTNFSASPAIFELSPDGNTLAISIGAGGAGNVVNIIDTNTGKIKNTLAAYQSWVSHMAYSSNGNFFTTFNQGEGKIFETDTFKPICNTGVVTFSSDEKFFSYRYYNNLVIAQLPNCDTYQEFNPSNEKSSFILSNDFNLIAENAMDGEIKIYDMKSKALKSTIINTDANEYQSWVFSDDNKYIAKSENRIMKTWIYDLETGEQVKSLSSFNPFFIENKVFTFSKGAINIWDLETNATLLTVWLPLEDWVTISPDGNLIAVSGFNYKINRFEIQVLDVTNSKVLYKYAGHSHGDSPARTIYLIFSPDSQELISIGPEGSILVWDTSH